MAGNDKVERLLNLVSLLLDTRRPLSVGDIRDKIPNYAGQSDDAFHRMFERDKNDVRDLGFVIEQEDIDAWGETGYRIRRSEALLDDPGFTPDELAALSIAGQAWGGGADGSLGLLKLSVGSGVAEPGSTGWLLPRVSLDRNIAVLLDAIVARKRVRFAYRTGGGGEPNEREVEPHGLYHRGTWYLAAYDPAREGVRNFKLSRVEGTIERSPGKDPDFERPAQRAIGVPRGPWEGEPEGTARVAFSPDTAWWAERRTGARRITEADDGWVTLEMPVAAELDSFAGWIAGFADAAVAVEPSELRDAVVARLRALAGR
ncbi:MAG TPA: WYL domain-containing protein [Actinomycetota bacterium]|nr:WYL domain-containing protein [Actinomycetota bacterium]